MPILLIISLGLIGYYCKIETAVLSKRHIFNEFFYVRQHTLRFFFVIIVVISVFVHGFHRC